MYITKIPTTLQLNAIYNRLNNRKAGESIKTEAEKAERDLLKTNYAILAEYVANKYNQSDDTTIRFVSSDNTIIAEIPPENRSNLLNYTEKYSTEKAQAALATKPAPPKDPLADNPNYEQIFRLTKDNFVVKNYQRATFTREGVKQNFLLNKTTGEIYHNDQSHHRGKLGTYFGRYDFTTAKVNIRAPPLYVPKRKANLIAVQEEGVKTDSGDLSVGAAVSVSHTTTTAPLSNVVSDTGAVAAPKKVEEGGDEYAEERKAWIAAHPPPPIPSWVTEKDSPVKPRPTLATIEQYDRPVSFKRYFIGERMIFGGKSYFEAYDYEGSRDGYIVVSRKSAYPKHISEQEVEYEKDRLRERATYLGMAPEAFF